MTESPGHRKWPHHQVQERRLGRPVQVFVEGELIADTDDVIEVTEDGHPQRKYFARDGVRMDKLAPSHTVTECPFKGSAGYFDLTAGGKRFDDVVWSYEQPYDEHAALQGRVAFYEEKLPSIEFRTA